MKNNYISKKGGFTLIELMVVIAIIGILTAIVSANFGQSKAKARDAKRVSDLAQIQLTLELFFDRCNGYPETLELTAKNVTGANSCPDDPNIPGTKINLGYFISAIPKENATTGYDYAVNGSGSDYVLRAKFETNNSALTDAITSTTLKFPSDGSSNCTHPAEGSDYYYCVVPK